MMTLRLLVTKHRTHLLILSMVTLLEVTAEGAAEGHEETTVVVVGVEVMIATLLEETHQVTAATNAAKMVILHANVPMLHNKQVTQNVSNAEKLGIFHANVLKE